MLYVPPLILIQCSAIFVILFTSIIRASFLVKTNEGRTAKEELYNSKEDSVLQCAQRCTFISKDAIMKFDESKMTCLCFSSVNDKSKSKANNETDTKSFMFQKRMIKQFKNHALKKPSNQSSTPKTDTPNDAKYANDGIITTRSATHHLVEHEWWELDMEEVVKIGLIRLTLDSWALEQGHYKNITILTTVYAANDTWRECETFANPTQLILESICQPQVSARFVKIMNSLNRPLYLREVEVYDRGIFKIRNL